MPCWPRHGTPVGSADSMWGTSVPSECVGALQSLDNSEVVFMPSRGGWEGLFWRFYPASQDDVEVLLCRDTDCRLGRREKAAVERWLASDRDFHIMRDHPEHDTPILGGMWGCPGRDVVRDEGRLD